MVDPRGYDRGTGHAMKAGEVLEISIYNPHECIPQDESGHRQFIRIVGSGVHGRAPHFTRNPKIHD